MIVQPHARPILDIESCTNPQCVRALIRASHTFHEITGIRVQRRSADPLDQREAVTIYEERKS
jgi:hypothetical protein